jgi:oligopeptide transport system substrate-binding protein
MKRIPFYVSLPVLWFLILLFLPSCIIELDQPETSTTPFFKTDETVLNMYGTDPYSLDPATVADATSITYVIQIFSGLVRFNDNLEIVPDIAEKWDISSDGTVYTFYLKDNIQFHSGKEVTAKDFKYSWERACNPDTDSQAASTYLGDIIGADEMLAGEKDSIRGIEVVDDRILRITIEEPKSYFLYKLTYATAFVVNRSNVEIGKGWWRNPDGTGPFKLEKWEDNSLLVLERNEYDATGNSINIINYQLWTGRPMDLYETGQIDIGHVGLDYIEKITDKDADFYTQLEIFPELNVTYLGFNCQKPPFNDINIRQAFSMAINKNKLTSLVYNDALESAFGILPNGMPGFNDSLIGLDYDVNFAQKLITESEYGSISNLPSITITTGGWGGQLPAGLEAIIYEWRINLGVEVEVRQLEPEVYLYELMQEKDELFYCGWSADYPHPQNFLEILFTSGSEYNIGEYSNLEVDTLLQLASREYDRELSFELYRMAEQILVREAACLPLWYGKSYVLIKPYVEGYNLNPLGYSVLSEVKINQN